MLSVKFAAIFPHLAERQRRLRMGAEARALGYGGIRPVARAAGVREVTVSLGADELDAGAGPLSRPAAVAGGVKRLSDLDPGLRPALLALVEPGEWADPVAPLRWATKSTRKLAEELTRQGHRVGADTVGTCRGSRGSACRRTPRRSRAGSTRDAQFRYVNEKVKAHQGTADRVISVDTKKELVDQPQRLQRPIDLLRLESEQRRQPGQRAGWTGDVSRATSAVHPSNARAEPAPARSARTPGVLPQRAGLLGAVAAAGHLRCPPAGSGPRHQSSPRRYHTHAVADPLIRDGFRAARRIAFRIRRRNVAPYRGRPAFRPGRRHRVPARSRA